jgi:hypothetical protein
MYGYELPYILDHLTLEQVVMLYDYGIEFEELKAGILIGKLSELLVGNKSKSKVKDQSNDKPDKAEFYRRYGKRIKKIEKEK